jgi:tRNA G46 methylase TrmB
MDNLRWLHDGLKPGGRLWFATDYFDYFVQAKVLVLAHGGFRLVESAAPWEAFTSIYSRRFAGTRIHLLSAVRRSADEPGSEVQHQEQVDPHRQTDQRR